MTKNQEPQEPQEPSKIEKIKLHFKNHKELYLGILGTLAAVTIAETVRKTVVIENSEIKVVQMNYFGKNKNVEIHLEERSIPSKPIHEIGTDLYFASVSDAARKTGLNRTSISNHINGRNPHVHGRQFEELIPA